SVISAGIWAAYSGGTTLVSSGAWACVPTNGRSGANRNSTSPEPPINRPRDLSHRRLLLLMVSTSSLNHGSARSTIPCSFGGQLKTGNLWTRQDRQFPGRPRSVSSTLFAPRRRTRESLSRSLHARADAQPLV